MCGSELGTHCDDTWVLVFILSNVCVCVCVVMLLLMLCVCVCYITLLNLSCVLLFLLLFISLVVLSNQIRLDRIGFRSIYIFIKCVCVFMFVCCCCCCLGCWWWSLSHFESSDRCRNLCGEWPKRVECWSYVHLQFSSTLTVPYQCWCVCVCV